MAVTADPLVFLCHTGAQSSFVSLLYDELCRSHDEWVFFDKKSLRLGDSIYPGITQKLKHARISVVIISMEFMTKKWPLMELEHLIDAYENRTEKKGCNDDYELTIIPVFYELQPHDLTNEDNLRKWSMEWNRIAKENESKAKSLPLNIGKWKGALEKLKSFTGVTVSLNYSDQKLVIDEIVSRICKLLPPTVEHFYEDSMFYKGYRRLAKKIDNEFLIVQKAARNIECANQMKQPLVKLGLYGVSGSGKTTICQMLVDRYRKPFLFRSYHLHFPSEKPYEGKLLEGLKDTLKTVLGDRDDSLIRITNVNQAIFKLKKSIENHRVFLAIDNVCNWSTHYVREIMQGMCGASKVLVTSRSRNTLENMLCIQHNISVPTLNEQEAWTAFIEYSGIRHITLSPSNNAKRIANELYSFLDGCHPKLLFEVAKSLEEKETWDEQTLNQNINELRTDRYSTEKNIKDAVISALTKHARDFQDDKLQSVLSTMAILYPITDDVPTDMPLCNYVCAWSTLSRSENSELNGSQMLDNFGLWRICAEDVKAQVLNICKLIAAQSLDGTTLQDSILPKFQVVDQSCHKLVHIWGMNEAAHEVYSICNKKKGQPSLC